MNKFLLAVPAFCDFVNSTLQYVALNFISGSVYQMLRGGTIITTTVLSVFFLKTKILKHQYLGCALAFFGVFIVGFSSLAFADNSGSGASQVNHSLCRDCKSWVIFLLEFHFSLMDFFSFSNKNYFPSIILIL